MNVVWIILGLIIANIVVGQVLEYVSRKAGFIVAMLLLVGAGAANAGIALFFVRPAPVILALLLIVPWSILAGVRIRPTYLGEPFLIGEDPVLLRKNLSNVPQQKEDSCSP